MNQAEERTQYPMSNKEYPRMKDRRAVLAIPSFPFIPERCIQ